MKGLTENNKKNYNEIKYYHQTKQRDDNNRSCHDKISNNNNNSNMDGNHYSKNSQRMRDQKVKRKKQ